MMPHAAVLAVFMFPMTLWAAWTFEPPIDVTPVQGPKIFHHLDGAGRKHIAVSGTTVAVAWEDNRDGVSRCYVAMKPFAKNAFGGSRRVSGAKEAFEPAIVAIENGRFAVVWEEDGGIWARLVGPGMIGAPIRLAGHDSSQPSAGFSPQAGLWAAWSQRSGKYAAIHAARLGYSGHGNKLTPGAAIRVDEAPPAGDQGYPSVAALPTGAVVIAWEDRRQGHTAILYSQAQKGKKFIAGKRMNETQSVANSAGLGRGSGAMRVALAAQTGADVAAVWSDKRDFLSGYDVYAAFSKNGGAHFGANQMVQDSFGENTPQWHPAIASNGRGKLAAAWDDNRDGSSDIWLAWPTASGWSDNISMPGAAGEGVQSDPSVAMDSRGNLHLVWLEKTAADGPTRLRYGAGRADGKAATRGNESQRAISQAHAVQVASTHPSGRHGD